MLHQLIYRSQYRPGSGGVSSQVRAIVETSQRNNSRNRVTGYLVFDKTHFVQILEGARSDVDATFERIGKDDRHDAVLLICRRDIPRRDFPEWSMGGCVRSPEIEHIYDQHGFAEDVEFSVAGPDGVVSLAKDIAHWEAERRRSRGLSSS